MMFLFKKILNSVPRPWLIKLSYWVKPLIILWYRGNRYTDPIDGRSFRKFLPYGYALQRPNVLSPSTLSLERHRLLWLYLKRKSDFFSKKRSVLHFAPEQAFYSQFKKMTHLKYVTTDLHSPLADIKADICNLPFENETFDVILCNHVLEHITDDTQAMKELFRVMKKGGWGVFQVPQDVHREKTFEDNTITDPKERTCIFGQYDHVRIYGMDYFDKLQHIGFSVETIHCKDIASKEEIHQFCLNPTEILPICRKS